MKILAKLLLIGLITYSCTVDERPAYDVCENGQIINESLRENAVRLNIEDWPTEIRGFIAGEFPTYHVEDMATYTFQ